MLAGNLRLHCGESALDGSRAKWRDKLDPPRVSHEPLKWYNPTSHDSTRVALHDLPRGCAKDPLAIT